MSSGSGSSSRRSPPRGLSPIPTKSRTAETTTDANRARDRLRESVRFINCARSSARTAKIAIRSPSYSLRPVPNLVCASSMSIGSAANCFRASSKYLSTLASLPNSPIPGLFLSLHRSATWMCMGIDQLHEPTSPVAREMQSTADLLSLAAASFKKAALDDAPRAGSSGVDTPRAGVSGVATPRAGASGDGNTVLKFSHILIKHKDSRRPVDTELKPVTRTKDEAMDLAIDIHTNISRDLITFADAVVAFSECASGRHQGVVRSRLKRRRMRQSLHSAALVLDPGKISDIIETNSGYHIIQRAQARAAGESRRHRRHRGAARDGAGRDAVVRDGSGRDAVVRDGSGHNAVAQDTAERE